MKTRKTKKRNIIRRAVAFLLCMTMVLGLGMQDVIEQVYAEEASAVSEQSADVPETQEAGTEEVAAPEEETDPTASENTINSEETALTTQEEEPTAPEEDKEPTDPANPADPEENTDVTTPPTETTEPSAPAEPTTPADGTENTKPAEPAAPETPADSNGSGSSDDMTPGGGTGTDEQKPPVEEDTKEEPVSELTYAAEDGSFSVKAAAVSEDVDLSGIEIHASQVQKDSEEYAAAEELVAGALDAESRQIEELQAYDIWFTYTESGEAADLSGQVQISLEYTAPEFPEGTDAQLEVFCLNGGAAEAVDGTDALAAGCELYALAWAVPAESTDTWEWTDGQVIIKASAEKGVLPEGAEISVTPIVKTEEEELANLSEEERAEAEAINEQYAQTEEKLTADLEAQAAEEAAVLPAAEEVTADAEAADAASDSEETADASGTKTLEGFLAYDICFLVNGEEVEPADGEVNVSIEFNEAVIPEGVSEDAEVSVAHLKEEKNENGVDEIVVEDLTTAETTTVETTEKAEVKKVELVTESFSTFTIYWSGSYGRNTRNVRIHYVDTNGNDISGRGGVGFESGNNEINLGSDKYKIAISGYNHLYTTVERYDNEVRTTRIQRNYNGIQYQTEWGGWINIDPTQEWVETPGGDRYIYYYDIYLVYEYDSSSGETGGDGQLGAPEHRKYIKENTKGEDYTLTLDVTGKRGEKNGVDVLLVIDKSGSMGDGENSLMSNLKSVVKDKIVNTVLTDNSSNNIAIVSFSDHSARNTDLSVEWSNWQNKENVKNQIDYLWSNGGTNWELGMMQAETMLSKRANSENEKVVIFLSDGCPGYYYYENREGGLTQAGAGNPSPTDSSVTTAREQAAAYAAQSDYLKDATIYSVYLTDDTQSAMNDFTNDLKNNGIDAQTVNGTDLDSSLTGLINSIVAPTYKNVVIEDTLSEYVELSADPQYMVVKNVDDVEKILEEGEDYTLSVDDVPLSNGVVTKKITVTLLNGSALDHNATYSLSYHIKPTTSAIDTYIKQGYIHTGDADTDALDNYTSSGEPGFYSNESAVVRYSVNDGPEKTADYAKPVVQVKDHEIVIPDPNPIDGSITKTMGDITDIGYPITLEVKTRLEETSEDAEVDVILVIDNSNSMYGTPIAATRNAAKAFVENFIGADDGSINEKHRIGLVTYKSDAEIYNFGEYYAPKYFSNNVSEIERAIDNMQVSSNAQNGGTNTEAAFLKARELAGKTEKNTYVIFMTDGVPTYRMTNDNNYTSDDSGTGCSIQEFNEAVEAANSLTADVEGVYTVGLLIDMSEGEKEVARRLLASKNLYQYEGYQNCYLHQDGNWWNFNENAIDDNDRRYWDTEVDKTYSEGYFEITSLNDSGESLKEIWEALANIINNKTNGSTGDGWVVTDTMADYVDFRALDGSEMNGHELTLNQDGTTLTTVLPQEDGTSSDFIVAEYDSGSNTIKWHLNSQLAKQEITRGGVNYTYQLTYYVTFEDSGKTELRPTNDATYIEPGGDKPWIYPEKMPFFVNVIGVKSDADDGKLLQGATFKVYRDDKKEKLLGEYSSAVDGHFAFQLGQSDLDYNESSQTYTTTVYLEETVAPEGYVVDGTLHAIEITVSGVSYADETGNVQKGTPSGSVSIVHSCDVGDDIVAVDTTGELKLNYKNESRPNWAIVKRNGNDPTKLLEGARFELHKVNDSIVEIQASYWGVSLTNGVIAKWTDVTTSEEIETQFLPVGEYELWETTAPDGYSKSEVKWRINIAPTGVTVTANGESVNPLTDEEKTGLVLEEDVDYYPFDNVMLYELPSTGGPGIHLYMLGGVTLMIAGTLLVYKKRKEEVLRS